MRNFVIDLFVLTTGLVFAAPAVAQQQDGAPAGFTVYQVVGEGVNAPPIPLRIEGDRIVAPEGPDATITIQESQVTADRISMRMETPGGPARFVGVREGDAFAGYLFIEEGGERGVVPIALVPEGQPTNLSPSAETLSRAPGISRVEIVPSDVTLESGEERAFVARVFDESGTEVTGPPVEWFARGGTISPEGGFVGLNAGQRQIVALVDGRAVATTTVTVAEPEIASLAIYTDVPARMAVGSRVPLKIHGLNAIHRWELEPDVTITSSAPSVVAVEERTLVAVGPGRATVTTAAGEARQEYAIEVTAAPGELGIRGVPESAVRTGDVVHLSASPAGAWPVWSVAERGAEVWPDGVFVAEEPGTYTVLANLGDRVATARIPVEARGVTGRVHMNGHGRNLGTHTSDLWPQNGYVYIGTHQANQVRTYDVSDPANPVVADSQLFDARVVNDVKVNEAGTLLVATREGAVNRRNGILVFSLADPAHPELVSEYTETLTAGVHNVFWVGDLVYCVNDGTGDMHIIDVSDPASPREVGRWGIPVVGRSLHDVWVQDGIAYLSYLRDGLVILDVGGAGKSGTPEEPVLVSRIFYPGGPTHSAFRYGDYVFAGDEDFSLQGTVPQIEGLGADPRGPIHVIDVSDLEHPRYVGVYEVPEAGAHNFWIDEERGVLYVGYYQGGIRVVDISGELRGDLYRQGREIAYFLPAAAPTDAKLPFAPMVWGVFPMFSNGWQPTGEMLYATDYNSGLWSFTVELPEKPIS